jgi:hypothetical protein
MGRRGNQVTNVRSGVRSAALAGALFALAGHLGLLVAYGTVLPYRDQWQCTGVDLLGPWAAGSLGLRNFFTPLNDHWPVLTRWLSFGLLQANGQWNNLLEATVNALIFASAIALFLRAVLPGLQGWARPAFAVLVGAVMALPITWENTLWGIQSLVYLQIALSLIYLGAVCSQRHFSALWWLGHLAALAVLFTQHSAILAHVAAAAVLAWRWWKRDGDRRVAAAGFTFAALVVLLFSALFPSLTVTAALRADSWQLGLHVFLIQLSWPIAEPGWGVIIYLPWLVWTINRASAARWTSADSFIIATGLWVGGQAAAIGYGRAAETYTFASRYCDFLSLGWLLNAACFGRLWVAFPRRWIRLAILVFAAIWFVAPLKNFWWETSESHAGFNLTKRPGENDRNLQRLQHFFASHDSAPLLADSGTQQELFTYAPALLPLLTELKIQALLPPETGSPHARKDHGRFGWLPGILLKTPLWLCAAALLLVGRALLQTFPGGMPDHDRADESGASTRALCLWLVTFTGIAAAGWSAWSEPGTFNARSRIEAAFAPLRGDAILNELEFRRYDGNLHNIAAARGSVDTLPVEERIHWYGTRLNVKPDFKGVLRSQPFTVARQFIVLPFTGYPCFSGNGLRVRFLDSNGKETWESYIGPDPAVGWNMWAIDVTAHQGADASVFLFDGNDGNAGWVGVARPVQTNDAAFAGYWRALLRAERAEGTHRLLAVLTLVGLCACPLLFIFGKPFSGKKRSNAYGQHRG